MYLAGATERINALLRGEGDGQGLDLTTADVLGMQDACAYEVSCGFVLG